MIVLGATLLVGLLLGLLIPRCLCRNTSSVTGVFEKHDCLLKTCVTLVRSYKYKRSPPVTELLTAESDSRERRRLDPGTTSGSDVSWK